MHILESIYKLSLAVSVVLIFLVPTSAAAQFGGVPDVRNVEGLVSCVNLSFLDANILNNTCGDRFTTSGSFQIGDPLTNNRVPYSAGDIGKCVWTRGTSSASCVISRADGTGTLYQTTSVSGAMTTTPIDASGNLGTPEEQSAFDAVVGQPIANAVGSVANEAMNLIGMSLVTVSTMLLGMAGVFLNLVIVKTVFQFSLLIGNSPGLLLAWGILRDLGNMLLLFGFIFIGLATILDLQTYSVKRALPRLLIFAILMNFSLFAAEAVIDVSNVLSSTLYAQAKSKPCLGETTTGTIEVTEGSDSVTSNESCLLNYGLAGAMMEASGLSTLFQVPEGSTLTSIAVYVGLALFATIGAVVFFAAGIMLVVRALVLTFLMITAPIGFAAMALPPLRKFGNDWWNKLIHQAFFAPILILLILVSLKVSESFAGGNENGLAGALTQPNSSAMGVILVFTLVIGLLIASLMAAKKFGAMGADFAISTSSKFAGKATLGTTGWVGRRTVGRASAAAGRSIRNSNFGTTWTGKKLAGITDAGAKASYDLRGTKTFGNTQKALNKRTGLPLDFGTAQKGGIEAEVKASKENKVKYAKTLGKEYTETPEEFQARIQNLEAEAANATVAKDAATAAIGTTAAAAVAQEVATNAATSARQDLRNQKASAQLEVDKARATAEANPASSSARMQLRNAELELTRVSDEEAEAERKLTEETNKLAAARKAATDAQAAEKKASKTVETANKNLKEAKDKGRTSRDLKEVYVGKLTNSRLTGNENPATPWRRSGQLRPVFGVWGRANEEAAAAIKKTKGKSKIEEALDTIKEASEDKDKDKDKDESKK